MTKKFIVFGILIIILVGIFVPTHLVHAQLEWLIDPIFKSIANLLMTISSLALIICGWLFDLVVNFTIVEMASNIGDLSEVGKSITLAWATLRDVANMCFIFVLLFAAFKAMFQTSFGGIGTTIRNIVIVALLINFSLFFSKVVIDASNIVALGFYDEIADQSITIKIFGISKDIEGISPGVMNMLGMQTIYGSAVLDGITGAVSIMVFGIMSSVLMLILAVIFLMAGIMFAARFIILVFLMILSPLALIAYIIPGQKGQFDKWKNSLIDQSFFAPLYFALTWVVFKLGYALMKVPQGGELSKITEDPQGVMPLVLNFVLIIGLSIAALIISKQMATRSTAGFSAITGGIGAVAIGGAALAGRQTVGRAASRLAQSQRFQDFAASSVIGQKLLQGTRKIGSGSFDVRGVADTKLGKAVGAEKVMGMAGSVSAKAKGGYDARLQRQIEKKESFGKTLTTDEQKQNYAIRTADKWRVRRGSASAPQTVFGAMGRSNRIVASKMLNDQITPMENMLQTQRDNLTNQQNTATNLNQQMVNLQTELASLQAITNPTSAQTARINQLNTRSGPIDNLQNQIDANDTRMLNTNGQIAYLDGEATRLRQEITRLGIENPNVMAPLTLQQRARAAGAIAAGQQIPPGNQPRPIRADEQKY